MAMHQNKEIQDGITAASECASVCRATLHHCLGQGGKHAEREHIMGLIDCAASADLAAHFMVADACAESCEKFKGEEMSSCAKACRHCAETCRFMADF
jgi:hypothetical protein